ncbi:hypothetical protein AB833_30825 [Chromatiales bacterium (ex Bugula neritina AB1)]|nr:hypothetical protein AB833_30825 [Chromatiales bacterium (ex Bugula neritina AB1)]
MTIDSDDKLAKLQTELAAMKAEHREFVYKVTHDLLGPFRQIEGFANIILSSHGDLFDEKSRRHFDLIISGSQKGREILEALQGYSRLITADFSRTTVDCSDIIAEVKTELASLIEKDDAIISCDGAPIIFGNRTELYLLFYHLIHNALHFQSAGNSPLVSIEVEKSDTDWQFCVQDNGIGFREKMADRIFTVLKRGVSDKNYPGMGMGLAIARAVVQRHGGKIWSTTEPGKGSSFYFTISKVA